MNGYNYMYHHIYKSESENEMTNGEKIKEIFPQAEIIPLKCG